MKNNQKGIAPIIIALIVALVLGGGYMLVKQQERSSWKTYTSDKLGFSFQYPKENEIPPLEGINSVSGRRIGQVVLSPISHNAIQGTVFVEVDNQNENNDVAPTCNDNAISKERTMSINGVDFLKYDVSKERKQAGFPSDSESSATEYCAIHNGIAYKIIVMTAQYSVGNSVPDVNKNAVLNQIVASFKFISPSPVATSDWKTYTNEKYGFNFQYPKEWTVSDTSKGTTDATFEYSVYPPCNSSTCNDSGPLIQFALLKSSFSEYIGNTNFSNKSVYTLDGRTGFAVSSLSGSTYIFDKDGKAFTIIVGKPGIKEKSIGEEVDQIFSTFKFTTPTAVQLPKAISSIVENKLSVWVTQWKKVAPNFNLASFSKVNESTISSAYKINPCDAKCSSIFEDMKNLYAFSPNGEKFIDVHGGKMIEVKNGKHIFVPGEPDSSVLVIDKKLQTIQTVLFCGTPCGFSNAAWVDNNSLVVVGGESISDAEGINYKGQVATLYVVNLATQKVELYKWPTTAEQAR